MSHEGSFVIGGTRTVTARDDSSCRGMPAAGERERLRAELLRRIVAREEERQYLRRTPR